MDNSNNFDGQVSPKNKDMLQNVAALGTSRFSLTQYRPHQINLNVS